MKNNDNNNDNSISSKSSLLSRLFAVPCQTLCFNLLLSDTDYFVIASKHLEGDKTEGNPENGKYTWPLADVVFLGDSSAFLCDITKS